MDYILAIDNGLTVTKAVIFDLLGQQIGVSRGNVERLYPAPHFVERDMRGLWRATASAIRDVISKTNINPKQIIAVAATAHGDGVYLLDQAGEPLGNGILSLDSRAIKEVSNWKSNGVFEESLQLTGQTPHASAPSALLAWTKTNEPEKYAKISHILACKDWLRYCLTGTIGTDRTEASTSFTNVHTQEFDVSALELFDLKDLAHALPDMASSFDVVGKVSQDAASLTGLQEGTPVVAGLHDVTASVHGIGAHKTGVFGIVAGTYSINEAVSDAPQTDADWFCRNAIQAGKWNNMSISPASATNYDWFIDNFCATDARDALENNSSIHAVLSGEISSALGSASSIIYHPFLFGSPFGGEASASFLGLRGWHNRGDVAAALLEGIVFNHRHHVDALSKAFPADEARLTGGISRNPVIAQLFADILNLPVMVTNTDEAAAWGAALCAGAGVGAFESFESDPRDILSEAIVYQPDSNRAHHYQKRYEIYQEISANMVNIWQKLEELGENSRENFYE